MKYFWVPPASRQTEEEAQESCTGVSHALVTQDLKAFRHHSYWKLISVSAPQREATVIQFREEEVVY